MRLTSEFWVGAYVRRCFGEGAMAAVARRGAKEAGAIFVIVNRLDGTVDYYAPAPQSYFDSDDGPGERKFEKRLAAAPEAEATAKLEREKAMDPDFWVVEVEDRAGRCFLDVVE
ncbi:DUF1491 family protein [Breoghania sp. L-A4]|uniref:DUF1491 family protein n=1 Tax=Breoghania sp. L-A4 TaxID=2304600 RepID=UPI000E35A378|nr:DUF1491 family protein [Breoghania sp. L-A4]AXS39938.1 DUF1491 family protein [Breoghania sp. L-A4]